MTRVTHIESDERAGGLVDRAVSTLVRLLARQAAAEVIAGKQPTWDAGYDQNERPDEKARNHAQAPLCPRDS